MRARYPGRCPECDETIHAGDELVKVYEAWAHEDCDSSTVTTQNALCTRCNLFHAGPCSW